jgi:hypothetical protein
VFGFLAMHHCATGVVSSLAQGGGRLTCFFHIHANS